MTSSKFLENALLEETCTLLKLCHVFFYDIICKLDCNKMTICFVLVKGDMGNNDVKILKIIKLLV